ncbi:hypothetical protein ASZ90_015930 [hydrocarbon metagenome]|uniref:Uncharacterized protein n=1 Tax=hydrocarbon metagenome TaxID=938273 RepID=A0A0W8F0N4_9ZZZZ
MISGGVAILQGEVPGSGCSGGLVLVLDHGQDHLEPRDR